MATQVGAAQSAGVIDMRKGALDVLAAAAHQPLPAAAAHPTSITIDRPLGLGRRRPAPPPAVGFREVGADADGLEREQRLIAVVALVADEIPWDRGLRRLQLFARRQRRRQQARGVADVGPMQRHRDERPGFQIDGVLGLMGQVRPAVFHLRDLRIGVRRIHPFGVGGPLLAPAVEPGQRLARRRLEARGRGQPREELLVTLTGIPPHDAAHRGVRLEGGRVNRERLAREQSGLDQALLHPREDRPMRLHVDQASGA